MFSEYDVYAVARGCGERCNMERPIREERGVLGSMVITGSNDVELESCGSILSGLIFDTTLRRSVCVLFLVGTCHVGK